MATASTSIAIASWAGSSSIKALKGFLPILAHMEARVSAKHSSCLKSFESLASSSKPGGCFKP